MDKLLDLLNHNKLISETKNLIKEVYLMDDIPWVIGYSGGKDSTCTTQIVIETLIEMKLEKIELNKDVYIVSSDTLVETPMIIDTIKNTIESINKLAELKELPIKAQIIRPDYSRGFWANLIGRGYPCPNQTFRWCTDRMKIEPANKFINNVVNKYGEAVMILGVRDKESNSRDRVLETHTIEGKKLMRHTTMPNAYVFAPIRKFSIDDVWNYLLQNESPWGTNNKELFKLYSDSSEECPFMEDGSTKDYGSCGNSRFGCWVCTVVKQDKSLTGFINNGVEWLKPLLTYRNWLYSIRDKENLRMKRRSNGTLYFSKIKKINEEELLISSKGDRKKLIIKFQNGEWVDSLNNKWTVFTSVNSEIDAKNYINKNGIDLSTGENPRIIIKKVDEEYYQLGDGPFTLTTRKEMLKKLLTLQKSLKNGYELIKLDELLEIKKLWLKDGDWHDSVQKIYQEIYKEKLIFKNESYELFNEKDFDILNQLCLENKFNPIIYNELIQISQKYSGYLNRKDALKEIQKVLSKEYLFLEGADDNDNK